MNWEARGKHVCIWTKPACRFLRVWARVVRELRERREAEAATAEPELESEQESDEWILIG